jgi:hypothetical protein
LLPETAADRIAEQRKRGQTWCAKTLELADADCEVHVREEVAATGGWYWWEVTLLTAAGVVVGAAIGVLIGLASDRGGAVVVR